MPQQRKFDVLLAMRVTSDDAALLDLVSEMIPMAARLTIARAALRVGLETIKRDPSRALNPAKVAGDRQLDLPLKRAARR